MSLFSSLLSMPTDHDAGTLQYTVAMMIGSYAAWLASTVRVEQRGQLLVSQMLQLLMKCRLQLWAAAPGGSCYETPRDVDLCFVVLSCHEMWACLCLNCGRC